MQNILIYDSLDTSQLHLGPCFGSFITQYVLNGMRKQKGRCQLQACLLKNKFKNLQACFSSKEFIRTSKFMIVNHRFK